MFVNFNYHNTITIDTLNKRFYESRISLPIILVFFIIVFEHLSKALQ